MNLHILNDLHTEFGDMKVPYIDSDIVILAGDISVGISSYKWIENKFKNKKVIFVPGNHEYYYNNMTDLLKEFKERSIKSNNITVLDNDRLDIDDTVFLGCTMWTDFMLYDNQETAMHYSEIAMNDYNYIKIMTEDRHKEGLINANDLLTLNKKSTDFLKRELKNTGNKKVVVITHTAPSLKSSLPIYKNDILTASFVIDLEDMIKENNIDLWCHGHLHNSCDYIIHDTRVVCNPRGYKNHSENPEFKKDMIITI